jgi:hypothetical protein
MALTWYRHLQRNGKLNQMPFPLEECSVFGNFVITLTGYSYSTRNTTYVIEHTFLWKGVNNRKTGKTTMALTWYRHLQRNGKLNQILRRQTSRFHYG